MNTLARQARADVAGERLNLGEEVLGVACREFEDEVLGAELAQLLNLGPEVVGPALEQVAGVGRRRATAIVEDQPGVEARREGR